MIRLFAWLYNELMIPLSVGTLRLLKPFGSQKLRHLLADRESYPQIKKYPRPPILIHAASGEVEYAKPLIRLLRERDPDQPLVLTYFSPSALRLVEGLPVDDILALPFDQTKEMKDFLKRLNPCLVLIARTDVWPEFVRLCREQSRPVVLFSATFARPLRARSWFARTLDRWRYGNLRFIGTVSDRDERHLRSLKIDTPSAVLGDTRYDQVRFRLQQTRPLPFRSSGDPRFTGVLGSTWYEDDQVWIDALIESDLRQSFRWIWVPHEVSVRKIQDLCEQLRLSGFKVDRLSEVETWRGDILVVDKVGLLADLYAKADLAFVGGSFRAKVHSVMEPLAAGCPVVLGPYFLNNREATEFSEIPLVENIKMVTRVNDSEELKTWLRQLRPQLGNPRLREKIKAAIESRSHSTEKLLAELADRGIWPRN